MSIQQVISNPVVMDEMAKYLPSKDILSARLVTRDWAAAFEKPFIKAVPVILDELDLKLFTFVEGGDLRPRRMKHESFIITVRLDSPRRTRAVMEFCEKFGPQIKRLELLVVPTGEEMKGFCKMMDALKGNLEKLTVRFGRAEGNAENTDDDEVYDFPVMPCLKSLSFVGVEGGEVRAVDREQRFTPFVTGSCPNLEDLEISGFPELQKEVFNKINDSGEGLKLRSLELDDCPVSAMNALAAIRFSPPLKMLRLVPFFQEGMHGGQNGILNIGYYALPISLCSFLKNVANDLISLDLRLKTVFEKENEELWGPDQDPNEKITLPIMPKLKSLTLAALNASELSDDEKVQLDLLFEESFLMENIPCLKKMYPELLKLRLVNSEDVDLTANVMDEDDPTFQINEGIKRLEIKDDDMGQDWREFVIQQAAEAFPNADVIFL